MTESKGPWDHGSSAEKGAAGGTFSTARTQSASRNGNYTCLVGSLGLNVAWPWLELKPSWSNLLHILHPSPRQPPSPTHLTSTSTTPRKKRRRNRSTHAAASRTHPPQVTQVLRVDGSILASLRNPPSTLDRSTTPLLRPKRHRPDRYPADEKKLLQSQPIRSFLSPPAAENFQNSIYYSLLPCAVAPLLIHFRRNLVLLLF